MGGRGLAWEPKWRRIFLFDHELVLINDLLSMIMDFTPSF